MNDYAGDLYRLCDNCVHRFGVSPPCEDCDGQEYFEAGGQKRVYIVLQGEDCEGASVKAVFATEDQARRYVEENYAWYKKTGPRKWHWGCDYIEIEEWEVVGRCMR